jgi:CBS domain containing-hemolysin-like protein
VDSDQPPLYLLIVILVYLFSSLIETIAFYRYRYVSEKNRYAPYWLKFREQIIFSAYILKIFTFLLIIDLVFILIKPELYYIYFLILGVSVAVFFIVNLAMRYLGNLLRSFKLFDILISPYFVSSFILYPVYITYNFLRRLLKLKRRDVNLPDVEDPDVDYMDVEELEKELEEREIEMIKGIYDFRERTTVEIMVPRVDLIATDVKTPLIELKELIQREGHSRIPIFEDTIDNIIGIIHAKDLLKFGDHNEVELSDLVRDVIFVPETKKLNHLLLELQIEKNQMAIVVDEYGGVSGIVTIEDIIEEIVGEIQDEYDDEEKMIVKVGQNRYLINPKIDIGELNEELHLSIPDEDYETLGGFIYDRLERVPRQGDKIIEDDVELTVNKAF